MNDVSTNNINSYMNTRCCIFVSITFTMQPVADPAMGGPGGRSPPPLIDQNLGLDHGGAKQSASDTGANFHLNS